MKSVLSLSLIFIFSLFFSQDFEWGKPSQEEIELKSVPFEPTADAVTLKEYGELKIDYVGYELEEHIRIKILSPNGFSSAQKKWSYNSSNRFDKVIFREAQTINIVDGKTVITPIDKKDILVYNQSNDIEELAIAFPNIKVGSIIEYKVKIIRPYNIYYSAWYFQNALPTLSSKLKLKSASGTYTLIFPTPKLGKKYIGKNKLREWELNNVPSYNTYTKIYNISDNVERITFQYTSAKSFYGTYYSESTWQGFKNLINSKKEKSVEDLDFREYANKIQTGKNKFETLKNCLKFLRDNYKWDKYYATSTDRLKSNFLRTKTGNTADFNIFLQGILREKKINSQLAVNSLRSNGRIIVGYTVLSKLQTLVTIVSLDKEEKTMVDAAISKPEDGHFLSRNYFNHLVFGLDNISDNFIEVSPNLSEYVSQQELDIRNDSLNLKIRDQFKGYFELSSYKEQAFIKEPVVKITEGDKKELEEWKINYRTVNLENPNSSFLTIENPFVEKIKELTVEKDRDYPVELDFPFLKTIQLKVKIPEDYILNTDNFKETISVFDGKLQYAQSVGYKENNEAVITWSLLINQIIFQPKEINQYIDFTNKLSNTVSKIAVLKKK
ncbi:DUF3857 domain-containing protein [Epilithonimonas sp. UC225_85]|uniref:DUF3857 domain-containing protein n=1 Tax=Epilithonimonas sp. UC225_85 TaxID=3350167 RepID=UPI0036D20A88